MLKPKQVSFLPLFEMGEEEMPSNNDLHISASARWGIAKIQGENVENALKRFLKDKYPRMSAMQHERSLGFMLEIVAKLEQMNLSETPVKQEETAWVVRHQNDATAHALFHEKRVNDD